MSDPSTLVTEAHRIHADMGGLAMFIMSELSDVQEELAMGLYEAARQRLNRIKYVVGETRDPAHPLEWQWGRDENHIIMRKA